MNFFNRKHFTLNDIREGSIIRYEAFGGEIRTVKVTLVDEDIKDGRPGFDCRLAARGLNSKGQRCWKISNEERWGYLDQIVDVIRF